MLEANGLVERYAIGATYAYTLTPFAAEGLDVELKESGMAHRLSWVPRNHFDISFRRTRKRPLPTLDPVDPSQGPGDAVDEADEFERLWRPRGPLDTEFLPRPSILLTGSRSIWTEGRAKPCPGCNNAPLRSHVYCLRCDRWGLDGVIGRDRRAKRLAKQQAQAQAS